MKTRILSPVLLLLVALAGCQSGNPLAVMADPDAPPLARIAAAETIEQAAVDVLIIAYQRKAISADAIHSVRVAAHAFYDATTELRITVKATGAKTLDGNLLWQVINTLLLKILDERDKVPK